MNRLRLIAQWGISGILLPISINVIIYFGFITNYTRGAVSVEGFVNQYSHGIYRYRILGRELVLLVHRILDFFASRMGIVEHATFQKIEASARWIDIQGTAIFYLSYFVTNTIFLCLFCLALLLLLDSDRLKIARREKWNLYLADLLLVAISQYVLTPYDIPVYFLLILGIYLVARLERRTLPLAVLLVTVGTLFRESIALLLSFAWALYVLRFGLRLCREYIPLIFLSSVFILVYLLLRVVYGFSQSILGTITVLDNFDLQGMLGMLFALTMIGFFSMQYSRQEWNFALLFLLFAVPYLVTVVAGGLLFEIRLYIPLLLVFSLLPYLLISLQPVESVITNGPS